MPRTEVYQLRLTKPEKDELARRAKEQGISIAKLIRQRLSLDAGMGSASVNDFSDEVVSFANRVDELACRMPRINAERLARREIGLR